MLEPTYEYYCTMFRKHGLTPLPKHLWERAVRRAGQTVQLSDTAQDIETERREGWTYDR